MVDQMSERWKMRGEVYIKNFHLTVAFPGQTIMKLHFPHGHGHSENDCLRSCLFSQPTLRQAGELLRALTWCFISFMHPKVCSYLLANSSCLANHHLKFQNVVIHSTNIDLILMTSQTLSHSQEEHRIQRQGHDIQNPDVQNSLLARWLWRMAISPTNKVSMGWPLVWVLPPTSLLTTSGKWVALCSHFTDVGTKAEKKKLAQGPRANRW